MQYIPDRKLALGAAVRKLPATQHIVTTVSQTVHNLFILCLNYSYITNIITNIIII